MIRVDAYFFYQVGAALRLLKQFSSTTTRGEAQLALYPARHWLHLLLNQGSLRLRTSWPKGSELLASIDALLAEIKDDDGERRDEPISFFSAFYISNQVSEFETLLAAECQFADFYLVTQKGAYDTGVLTEYGERLFPHDLALKVPEALLDAREAARCIAFELPTAAAFHLHRVNETVLRHYFDVVTSGAPHPEKKSITAYIDAMKNLKVGDKVVFGALATLNSLHRNPVIHPQDRLESVDEAVALLGIVHTTVTHMLKRLPPPELKLVPPPSDEKAVAQIAGPTT